MKFPLKLRLDEGSSGSLDLRAEVLPASRQRPRWKVSIRAGESGFTGACTLALGDDRAEQTPWFLFPGFFYGQGRTDETRSTPRLEALDLARWNSPSWDFALDRGAYPVLLARLGERWIGLDWSPHYELQGESTPVHWGESEPQIGPGFSWQNGRGELRLNIPANERPRSYTRSRYDSATSKVLRLAPGQVLSFRIGYWEFHGDAHAYAPVLETVYEELSATNEPAPQEPYDTLTASAAHGLMKWHWVEATAERPGYMVYSVPFDRTGESIANTKGTTLSWHAESLGFTGGFPTAFGLLWYSSRSGDASTRDVAEQLIERYCREGQTDWGFFRTSYHPARAYTANGDFPNAVPMGVVPDGARAAYGSWWMEDQSLLHARTTADATLYLARCLALIGTEHPGFQIWRASLRRSLEAALESQSDDGRFGQLYDFMERRVAQHDGCGGLLWIVALHHAEPLFADDVEFQSRLNGSMTRAGEGYAVDVENEHIYGAPEDVALTPTSEDGYNAVMAYAALHRRFGGEEYLRLLIKAADWTLTWRKAYNVRFDRKSILHSFRSVGGDFASSQNNHLHIYGLCCLKDFHYLAEVTGKEYYARRADEHWRFATQLLCTTAGQWNGQRGMCSEQFYVSDWSVWGDWDPTPQHEQKGTLCGFSAVWCVNMMLLGAQQLEGLEASP